MSRPGPEYQVVRQIDYVIETRQKIIASTGSFVARGKARREMIAALLQRAQYLGDLSAYDTALAVADEMIAADRERPDRHLHHARVLSALHRFAEASAALDRAEAEGSRPRPSSSRGSACCSTGESRSRRSIGSRRSTS